MTLIYIALDLTNSVIASGFNFYYHKHKYRQIDNIGLSLGQAFAILKLWYFFSQEVLGESEILLRDLHFIIHNLVKFCMKKLHKENRYRDIY